MIEIADSEKIIRIVRKHWFVLLGDIFMLIFFVAIPVVLLFAFHLLPFDSILRFEGSQASASTFFFFAWIFIVWMIGWNMWTDYYLDVLLLTNSRIFDIEQHGLFRRTSASFRINKIQNVSVLQVGIIQTMLDFGTLKLETAGEGEDFTASFIAHPYEVKKFINELQDRDEESSKLVHFEGAPHAPLATKEEKLTRNDGEGL